MKHLFLSFALLISVAPAALCVTSVNSVADFKEKVNASPYLVVDFYMTTCGPCKELAPILVDVEALLPGVTIIKVNIQDHAVRELSNQFNIRSVPTLVLLKNGKEINRIIGNNKTAEQLANTLKVIFQLP